MNFKLLALIAFATAVIAAPASEDVQADSIDTHAEVPSHEFEPYVPYPETPDTQVNAEARSDYFETEYHEEPQAQPKSTGYQAQPKSPGPSGRCRIGHAQCCNILRVANQDDTRAMFTLKGVLGLDQDIDPDALTGMFGLGCKPITGRISSCSSQAVCCSEIHSRGYFALGCIPIEVE